MTLRQWRFIERSSCGIQSTPVEILSKGPPVGSSRLHIDHRSICEITQHDAVRFMRVVDPSVGIRPLHIGETCQLYDSPRHSPTPAIISMIRVDQVKHHQGKASPLVGPGCQGSLQILEDKAGNLLIEQGFVPVTEQVSR